MRVRTRIVIAMFAIAGTLAVGSCASSMNPVSEIPDTASFHNPAVQVLEKGDVVRIVVFGRDDLSRAHVIDSDGGISLSTLGRVKAAGLTPAELEREIARLLAERGMEGAQVSVLRD